MSAISAGRRGHDSNLRGERAASNNFMGSELLCTTSDQVRKPYLIAESVVNSRAGILSRLAKRLRQQIAPSPRQWRCVIYAFAHGIGVYRVPSIVIHYRGLVHSS